jgi:hypothetical protein
VDERVSEIRRVRETPHTAYTRTNHKKPPRIRRIDLLFGAMRGSFLLLL